MNKSEQSITNIIQYRDGQGDTGQKENGDKAGDETS